MRRIVLAIVFTAWLLAISISPLLAASPSPSGGGAYGGGDTRTAGQGPGLVGSPLYALGGVALVALLSIGLSLLYLRVTPAGPAAPIRPDGPAEPPEPPE